MTAESLIDGMTEATDKQVAAIEEVVRTYLILDKQLDAAIRACYNDAAIRSALADADTARHSLGKKLKDAYFLVRK